MTDMEQIFDVERGEVLEEVGRTTAYVGSRMTGTADDAYGRIATTETNEDLLVRFWAEAKSGLLESIRYCLTAEEETDGHFHLVLDLPPTWGEAIGRSMAETLRSYFVNHILASWFMIVNKEESQAYATLSEGYLKDFRQGTLHRKRPERPTP